MTSISFDTRFKEKVKHHHITYVLARVQELNESVVSYIRRPGVYVKSRQLYAG